MVKGFGRRNPPAETLFFCADSTHWPLATANEKGMNGEKSGKRKEVMDSEATKS